MIRCLSLALESLCVAATWTAKAVHWVTWGAVGLIFVSLTATPGGSVSAALVVSAALLGFNYLIARPIGRVATRALSKPNV